MSTVCEKCDKCSSRVPLCLTRASDVLIITESKRLFPRQISTLFHGVVVGVTKIIHPPTKMRGGAGWRRHTQALGGKKLTEKTCLCNFVRRKASASGNQLNWCWSSHSAVQQTESLASVLPLVRISCVLLETITLQIYGYNFLFSPSVCTGTGWPQCETFIWPFL